MTLEVPKGLTINHNKNGFLAVRVHYTCVPHFCSEKWKKNARRGYLTQDQWDQEMEINFTLAGTKKMYPMFNYETHVTKLAAIRDCYLLVGWDYGYWHPAVTIAQINTYDQLCVLDEMKGNGITIQKFTREVMRYLKANFKSHYTRKLIEHFCDPAGRQHNDKSEFTSVQIQRKMGVFVRWRESSIKHGIRIIQQLMTPREDGVIQFRIDPRCRILIEGFQGGYTEDVPHTGKESKEMPFPDEYYPHNQDALRYLVVNKYSSYGGIFKPKRTIITGRDINPISDDDEDMDKQSSITGYT